jgi:16S rRNA processing protein RimM
LEEHLAPQSGTTIRDPEKSEFITLAYVVKTQGRRGEVAVEVHSDVPDRFTAGMKLSALRLNSDEHRALEVEDFWPHKDFLILKFAGVDSISDAETLIGCELQIPASQRAELETGWNYVSDLIGCTLLDHEREVGRISDVTFGAGEAPLLIVKNAAGKRSEIPFAEAYLDRVELQKRRIQMNLPEGLLEVNAPLTEEEKQEQARPRRNKR